MDVAHVTNVSYLCRPMNESAGGGIYVPVPPCYNSCHASDVQSINTISLISFFVALIPSILISMCFHRYYAKRIWVKYKGHLPPTDEVTAYRTVSALFIFKHILKGITLAGILNSIFISMYIAFWSTYGMCQDLKGSSNTALTWWIFIWSVGLISFCYVWYLNIEYELIWDDPIGFKLAKFVILQITAMVVCIIYSQTVHVGDLYKERGVYGSALLSADCVCEDMNSLAFQIASFVVILCAGIIFHSYKKAQTHLVTCGKTCCLGPIIIFLTAFILFSRFQNYNKKVQGISGFNIDGGDLFLLWCIFNLFLFGGSGIFKLIKNDKDGMKGVMRKQFKTQLLVNDSEVDGNRNQERPELNNYNFTSTTSTQTALPFGWQKVMTINGKIYYQNHVTKQTQWEMPM